MLWTSQINFNKTANSHTDDRQFIRRTSCLLTFHHLFFSQILFASLSQNLSEEQSDHCVSSSGSVCQRFLVWVYSAHLHLWLARERRTQGVKHLWHDKCVSLIWYKRIPSLCLLVSAAELSCNKGASGLLRSGLFGFRQLCMVSWPGLVWDTNTYSIISIYL